VLSLLSHKNRACAGLGAYSSSKISGLCMGYFTALFFVLTLLLDRIMLLL